MKIFDGKKFAERILNDIGESIKKEKMQPALAVILVGENKASRLYVRLKKESAAKIGIKVEECFFNSEADQKEIILKIKELNGKTNVSGIIVHLPLPANFDADKIIQAIEPKKDVDGFHKESLRFFENGQESLAPPLPSGILLSVKAAGVDLKNKKILALVRSKIFGDGLKAVFKKDGLKLDYIIKKSCSFSCAGAKVRSADVLITVLGCPNFIRSDAIKENAVLIDAGITLMPDGKLAGDIDRESVKGKAGFLTPVPGGIGPLTVALLLKNVYFAARNH